MGRRSKLLFKPKVGARTPAPGAGARRSSVEGEAANEPTINIGDADTELQPPVAEVVVTTSVETPSSTTTITTRSPSPQKRARDTPVIHLPPSGPFPALRPNTPFLLVPHEQPPIIIRSLPISAERTPSAITSERPLAERSSRKPGRKRKEPKKQRIAFKSNKIKAPLDKNKMTMAELLLYNPPMSEEQKERRRQQDEEDQEFQAKIEESIESESVTERERPRENIGPRVRVGAKGELVVDEKSLVVDKLHEDEEAEPIFESSNRPSVVTYASFRPNRSAKRMRWSDLETLEFYKALAIVGTDFSMMSDLFFKNTRTRQDLRKKFKKEEKINMALVERALNMQDISMAEISKEKSPTKSRSKAKAADKGPDPAPTTRRRRGKT